MAQGSLRILINRNWQSLEAAGQVQAGGGRATTILSSSRCVFWGSRSGSWLGVLPSCLEGGWGYPCHQGLPRIPALVHRAQSLFPRLKPSQLKSSKPRVVGATPPPSGSSLQGLLWGQVLPATPLALGGQVPQAVPSHPSLLGGQSFLWVQKGLGFPCVQDSQGHPRGQEVQEDPWALGGPEGLGAPWVPGASGCQSR